MAESLASAPGLLQRLGRFGSLAVLLMAVLASGFAIETLVNSQSVGGSFERRNTHELAIIAQLLERRQRDFTRVAKAKYSLGLQSLDVPHPDLGNIHIAYDCNKPWGDDSRLFPRGLRYDDGDQYRISSEFLPDPTPASTHSPAVAAPQPAAGAVRAAAPAVTNKPVCFNVTFSLEKLIARANTAPDIANVLIVAPDGTVLEQYGREKLPIAKLPQLEVSDILSDDVRNSMSPGQSAAAPAPQRESFEQGANAGTARLTIDGDDYRGYIQPFQLTVPEPICRSAVTASRTVPTRSASGSPATAVSPGTDNAQRVPDSGAALTECQLYLVGLVPASTARSEWLTPPRFALVGFSLTFAFVVSLLPLARLLLINNTESVSALGVLAIVVGLVAAAAIATLGLLFVSEISAERKLAADEAGAVASSMARGIGHEFGLLDIASRDCRGDGVPGSSTSYLIDAGFFYADGRPSDQRLACPGVPQVTQTWVGNRRYFEKLSELPPNSHKFVIEEIVGQTDGLDKTVLARFGTADPLKQPERYALRVTTTIGNLIAPTLPPPEKFMVVDAGRDDLPVLFHSRRSRAGFDNLVDEIDAPMRVINQLRQLVATKPDHGNRVPQVSAFGSVYDGRKSQFAAASVPGSKWVVLVYYATDDVDAIAASTAVNALTTWTGFSICALFVLGLALARARPKAWRRLWPFESGADEYRRLAKLAMVLSFAVLILRMALAAIGPSLLLDLMPAIAIFVAAGFLVHAFFRLGALPLTAAPLTPRTERAYRQLVLMILVCAAVTPMILFWADARTLSRSDADINRSNVANRELNEFATRSAALKTVPHQHWAPAKTATIAEQPEHGLTAMIRSLAEGTTLPTFNRCLDPTGSPAATYAHRDWFCIRNDAVGVVARPLAVPSSVQWMVIIVFTIADLAMFYTLVGAGLEALTGFGIPLGAVTWPKLVIDGAADPNKNQLKLSRKTLLVAPQQAVRDRLAMLPRAFPVNLSDQLLPASDEALKPNGDTPPIVPTPWKGMTQAPAPVKVGEPSLWGQLRALWDHPADSEVPPAPWLIVSGLELVLRNALRRRAALAYLERAASVLSVENQTELNGLVIIAEMAPLERILDAFESFAEHDPERLSTREELRWAQLFQDFSTFYFAPIDKVRNSLVPAGTSAEAWALIEELRWLPGAVIDGVIADHTSRDALTLQDGHGDKSFPLAADAYCRHYTPLIARWASSLGAKTKEAAVDYMRANLIEHYEQCWAASSFAERVILDAVAHHSFINMRKGVALQSLVRRGLLILDPAPRLMNRSFALYLRQTERPDTLADWKKAQPRSTWSAAQLPLALLIPAALLLLALGAAESGEALSTLFPLIAAGLPAVVSLMMRSAKSQ